MPLELNLVPGIQSLYGRKRGSVLEVLRFDSHPVAKRQSHQTLVPLVVTFSAAVARSDSAHSAPYSVQAEARMFYSKVCD